MKKILLVIAAFVLYSSARSQNLSFGPTAGFGHSWLSLSENDGLKNKFHSSYNVGGKLVYSFVSSWGISADVKFSSEGGTKQFEGENTEYNYRVNYVRIPLQAIYFFEQLGDRARPKVSIGPSFGFLVGGESKQEENGTETTSVASKDLFSGFDFGLNGAIGCNIRVGKATWLNTDITYYHGFSNIADNGDVKIRNRGLGLNIGLLFPIGTVKPAK